MMVAQVCGLQVGDFVHTFGDCHLYINHLDQTNEQLSRTPRTLPKMNINKTIKNIFNFSYTDFNLEDYDPDPPIKAPVAV